MFDVQLDLCWKTTLLLRQSSLRNADAERSYVTLYVLSDVDISVLCTKEDLEMFEFIETRRLATGEGIPLDDVTDEMKRQDSMYIYIHCMTLYV